MFDYETYAKFDERNIKTLLTFVMAFLKEEFIVE